MQKVTATREGSFKAEIKPREDQEDSCYELDEEDEKFVRKLKRESGKYKGKLPLKCLVVEN